MSIITITKEKAFESIDALTQVNEATVLYQKPSYSNAGDQIYVGSSRVAARLFGALASRVVYWNQTHANLSPIADRIVTALISDVAANKDAEQLFEQAIRVSNAVNGLRLMRGVHYKTREENEYLDYAIRSLGTAATILKTRAEEIQLGQAQMDAAKAAAGQVLASLGVK